MSENAALLLITGLGLIAAGTIFYLKNDKNKPWAVGRLICFSCGHQHVGVWLIKSAPVDCPFCLKPKSCFPVDGVGFGEAQELVREMEKVS